MRIAMVALACLGLAGCGGGGPAPGGGGLAEANTAEPALIAPYWDESTIHREMLADANALRPRNGAPVQNEAWINARLEVMSCLDYKLERLSGLGGRATYPAEFALASADRRRSLRELMGGLTFDGELSLERYRERVRRIEALVYEQRGHLPNELIALQCPRV
ncbi:MAG: hypothetical protein ACFB3T_15390 [Geminicoccaceae bacterium]